MVGAGAVEELNAHRDDCLFELRGLLTPMWSIVWPYYWAEEKDKKWGLEMGWFSRETARPYRPVEIGSDPKSWHLFT